MICNLNLLEQSIQILTWELVPKSEQTMYFKETYKYTLVENCLFSVGTSTVYNTLTNHDIHVHHQHWRVEIRTIGRHRGKKNRRSGKARGARTQLLGQRTLATTFLSPYGYYFV